MKADEICNIVKSLARKYLPTSTESHNLKTGRAANRRRLSRGRLNLPVKRHLP